ncbi:hypothetical protein KY333_02935 [Candidatus Woesearchaeota archaeon]|nr:hypothetical protein [Candidatus Woesearchaeota archaeon]MBW2993873.1 hypothetical protein [Candidatus Woesearchaeota archaeon]
MPEIMPFGRFGKQRLSVEQIALKDYKYFVWVMDNIELRKPSLRNRFDYVEHVVNNFKSQQPCANSGCDEPAKHASIYRNWYMNYQGSGLSFVYCSEDCWHAGATGAQQSKISLEPLKFRTALASTKGDTNNLVKMMAECMGLRKGRRTKEYLEEFFDNCELWTPF